MATAERTRRSWWQSGWFKWTAGSVLVVVVAFFAVAEYVLHNAAPILRKRIIATLSERLNTNVELDTLDISLLKGIEVTGGGLRVPYNAPPPGGIQGKTDPHRVLIGVDRFTFRSTWGELMRPKTHISVVNVEGVTVDLPAGEERKKLFGPKDNGTAADPTNPRTKPKIAFIVDELRGRRVRLIIENKDPNKESKEWDLDDLYVHDLGASHPATYTTVIQNPIPKGEIHAQGHVGPWNAENPRQTYVDGDYTFNNADMDSIKGLGGIMNAKGKFVGVLEKMTTDGEADVDNFSLDISDRPVPLHTQYHAYVDATTGDTTLDPVHAMLGGTPILCSGSIVNIKGKGHDVNLDATIDKGQMRDVLALAMKGPKPVMHGVLSLKTHIHIPPGKERVAQKIELAGNITINGMVLTNQKLQDRMDGLSQRAQGKADTMAIAATNGSPDVTGQVKTAFVLKNGQAMFNNIVYEMPGAHIKMQGVYGLTDEAFDFKGIVRTDATASQMISGWKSWLLKPVDPLFKKNGAGVQLPIEISGIKDDLHFGLAFKHGDDTAAEIGKGMKIKQSMGEMKYDKKKPTPEEERKQKEKDAKNYAKMKAQAEKEKEKLAKDQAEEKKDRAPEK